MAPTATTARARIKPYRYLKKGRPIGKIGSNRFFLDRRRKRKVNLWYDDLAHAYFPLSQRHQSHQSVLWRDSV